MLGLRGATTGSPEDIEAQRASEAIRDLRVKLQGDRFHLYVAYRFYGKMMTLTLTSKVRVQGRRLHLEPEGGRLGSLPLPSFTLAYALGRVFSSEENRDKFRVPREIRDIRVQRNELIVSVNSSPLTLP